MSAVIEASGLARDYRLGLGWLRRGATLRALAGTSFSLSAGETLAVVGESGSGKSTLARLVTMIEPPSAGRLLIDGNDVSRADRRARRALRRQVQIVFQDPYGSLNPRQTIGRILEEPLRINTDLDRAARRRAVRDMLAMVGLRPEHEDRYAHMFSGGQRQRIAIARALMLRPRVLVLDEPVSALDVSVRAQVLNLLLDLQTEFGLAYLFISHDLSVVRQVADTVMVLYLGRPVEHGPKAEIFGAPRHPYTRALLDATPIADPARRGRERIRLRGDLPSPLAPPAGCAFNTRCPFADDRCRSEPPQLRTDGLTLVACHAVGEGRLQAWRAPVD